MTVAAAATMLFATQNITAQETESEVAMTETEVQAPVQDGFEKIETSALPETVTNAVATDKAGSKVEEAYFNEELSVYKLMLKAEGAEAETAYINEEGKWVKIQ
ncbi:hypothetical protein DSM03_101885 [Leeuwenhoekiella aestuarii]|uniref:PepSY domain-containing protein n=2 Tax=Leeuwenhoekiella aestuarii TaxID=2249426 RepID=A0A4Q0P018_9FLAO|nr:hypothetical protein DSM04_101394 [Leeuwenhoekiella aestuarii]RXG19510.1 hypothetical protein DSM03_101885 [Leeuwenhoekiella aestuarii]